MAGDAYLVKQAMQLANAVIDLLGQVAGIHGLPEWCWLRADTLRRQSNDLNGGQGSRRCRCRVKLVMSMVDRLDKRGGYRPSV